MVEYALRKVEEGYIVTSAMRPDEYGRMWAYSDIDDALKQLKKLMEKQNDTE